MKKVRRNMYGRKYTTFGYFLHLALTVSGFTSFILLLGCAGESDLGGELDVMKVIICTIVFGASVLLHNRIFE